MVILKFILYFASQRYLVPVLAFSFGLGVQWEGRTHNPNTVRPPLLGFIVTFEVVIILLLS